MPEGYFDRLADNVMNRLPGEETADAVSIGQPKRKARVRLLRPLLAAAACIVAAVLTAVVFFNREAADTAQQQAVTAQAAIAESDCPICEFGFQVLVHLHSVRVSAALGIVGASPALLSLARDFTPSVAVGVGSSERSMKRVLPCLSHTFRPWLRGVGSRP